LFGVGAGYAVVSTLVLAARVLINRAAATVLVVVAINSAVALVVQRGRLGPPVQSAAVGALMAAVADFTVTSPSSAP